MLKTLQNLIHKPQETGDKPIQTFIKVLEKLETQSRTAPEVKSKSKTKGNT
jgi:hypothetical protein